MSYVPSGEKLTSLGFELQDTIMQALLAVWIRRPAGQMVQELHLYQDGSIALQHPAEIAEEWGLGPRLSTLSIACPSEVFFDQLLVAVGWQPTP